jgi:hypothetical protein
MAIIRYGYPNLSWLSGWFLPQERAAKDLKKHPNLRLGFRKG